jgi:hypothetical protein
MQLWNDWNVQAHEWAVDHPHLVDYMLVRIEDLLGVNGLPKRMEVLDALADFVGSPLTRSELCCLSLQRTKDKGQSSKNLGEGGLYGGRGRPFSRPRIGSAVGLQDYYNRHSHGVINPNHVASDAIKEDHGFGSKVLDTISQRREQSHQNHGQDSGKAESGGVDGNDPNINKDSNTVYITPIRVVEDDTRDKESYSLSEQNSDPAEEEEEERPSKSAEEEEEMHDEDEDEAENMEEEEDEENEKNKSNQNDEDEDKGEEEVKDDDDAKAVNNEEVGDEDEDNKADDTENNEEEEEKAESLGVDKDDDKAEVDNEDLEEIQVEGKKLDGINKGKDVENEEEDQDVDKDDDKAEVKEGDAKDVLDDKEDERNDADKEDDNAEIKNEYTEKEEDKDEEKSQDIEEENKDDDKVEDNGEGKDEEEEDEKLQNGDGKERGGGEEENQVMGEEKEDEQVEEENEAQDEEEEENEAQDEEEEENEAQDEEEEENKDQGEEEEEENEGQDQEEEEEEEKQSRRRRLLSEPIERSTTKTTTTTKRSPESPPPPPIDVEIKRTTNQFIDAFVSRVDFWKKAVTERVESVDDAQNMLKLGKELGTRWNHIVARVQKEGGDIAVRYVEEKFDVDGVERLMGEIRDKIRSGKLLVGTGDGGYSSNKSSNRPPPMKGLGIKDVTKRYGKWQEVLEKNEALATSFYTEGEAGLRIFGYHPAQEIQYYYGTATTSQPRRTEDDQCNADDPALKTSCMAVQPKSTSPLRTNGHP